MTYTELYPQLFDGIMTIFADGYPVDYKLFFGDISPQSLNTWIKNKYGCRIMLKQLNEGNKDVFIKSIIALNLDSWREIANLLNERYELINPVVTHETTETITHTETDNQSGTTAEKAYNDNVFTNDNKSEKNIERAKTESNNRLEVTTGNKDNKTEVIKKEIELRKENLKKTIIFAIINEISINII